MLESWLKDEIMIESGCSIAMDKDDECMISKVLYALGEVYRNDYFLVENNCHELSIVGSFYRYFRNEYDDYFNSNFPGVSIDMEYSKMGEELCAKPAPTNDMGKKHMRIDFVVHKRKCQTQNLLAIEFKLKGRKKDINWDYDKLKAITVKADDVSQVRNYELGISALLKDDGVEMRFFKDGKERCSLPYKWNGRILENVKA